MPPRSPMRCCARWRRRKSPPFSRLTNPSVILRHSYAETERLSDPFIFLLFTFVFIGQSPLPKILLLAGLFGDPARQNKKEIAQPVDVFYHLGFDFFLAR